MAAPTVGNQFRFPLIHWKGFEKYIYVGWKPIQIPFDTLGTRIDKSTVLLETNSDSL